MTTEPFGESSELTLYILWEGDSVTLEKCNTPQKQAWIREDLVFEGVISEDTCPCFRCAEHLATSGTQTVEGPAQFVYYSKSLLPA